jgi:hypothetical protein
MSDYVPPGYVQPLPQIATIDNSFIGASFDNQIDEPPPFATLYPFVTADQYIDPGQFTTREKISARTEIHTGNYICPVAGPPGTPPQILNVHAGYSCRVVPWTVERVGSKPRIPSPLPVSPYEFLLSAVYVEENPILGPQGHYIFRYSGTYVFGQLFIPTDTGGVKSTVDLNSASFFGINPAMFDPTIIAPPS